MSAPVKFLFEDDFASGHGAPGRRTITAAAHEAAIARAEADGFRKGMNAAEAKIEGRATGALERTAAPHQAGAALLVRAAEAGGLSARGWTRTLRIARTIADLEGATGVRRVHIAEALIYRRAAVGAATRFEPVTAR